jgi:hypothetical protein
VEIVTKARLGESAVGPVLCQLRSFGVTTVKLIFAINCQYSSQPKRATNDL